MRKYPKIKTIFKRDMANEGRLIIGKYALPEFEYLANNKWLFTEKVNGTNIRIEWRAECDIKIGGRTDEAQIPIFLYEQIQKLLPAEKFETSVAKTDTLCLYGEGYGARIQKGGSNYKPDGVDFVLFDVLVDNWWLKREDVEEIASNLGIEVVPLVGYGNLGEAIKIAENGFQSHWGNFIAEGLVLRPAIELQTRAGSRIIAKIKHKDFK